MHKTSNQRIHRKIEISCPITNACSLALPLVRLMLGCTALLAAQVTAQASTQGAATNNPQRDMIKALEASSPHSSLGEEARVFDRFVGTWECDFANFDDDGKVKRAHGAKLKKWRIVWVLPEARVIQTLIGGAVGDRVVLDGTGDGGSLLRWSFNEIRSDSFVWRSEKSRDEGKTWRLTGEYQMRRRNASAPVDSERKS